jgi:hypothetical protein
MVRISISPPRLTQSSRRFRAKMQPFNVGDLVVYEGNGGRALTVSAVLFEGPRWWLAFEGYPRRYWSLASLFRPA